MHNQNLSPIATLLTIAVLGLGLWFFDSDRLLFFYILMLLMLATQPLVLLIKQESEQSFKLKITLIALGLTIGIWMSFITQITADLTPQQIAMGTFFFLGISAIITGIRLIRRDALIKRDGYIVR
jgi:hypothetical protein